MSARMGNHDWPIGIPNCAGELEAIVPANGDTLPQRLLVSKCLLGNWTGGSVAAYLRHYPRIWRQCRFAMSASSPAKGDMTIPLPTARQAACLMSRAISFEFHARGGGREFSSSNARRPRSPGGPFLLHLLTTAAGLYRYHIHDLVRVTGFHNRTPLVEFLSKESYRQHHRRKALRASGDSGDV